MDRYCHTGRYRGGIGSGVGPVCPAPARRRVFLYWMQLLQPRRCMTLRQRRRSHIIFPLSFIFIYPQYKSSFGGFCLDTQRVLPGAFIQQKPPFTQRTEGCLKGMAHSLDCLSMRRTMSAYFSHSSAANSSVSASVRMMIEGLVAWGQM